MALCHEAVKKNVFQTRQDTYATSDYYRNVCILAHVDHGKTTLSDYLVSSNRIISEASAGRVRFLDSREDEQSRLITMKSSCITLQYEARPLPIFRDCEKVEEEKPALINNALPRSGPYWINLVDSPGHVDFSFEVSAAVRLCDGALLLVDAVEGVCPQTRQVAAHAFAEKTRILLVINKMDKLFTELHMSATEIVSHVTSIIEQVNAVMQQLLVQEAMEKASAVVQPSTTAPLDAPTTFGTPSTPATEQSGAQGAAHFSVDHTLETQLQFSPEKGNVIFCSAADGWAFDISIFAEILRRKLNLPLKALPKLASALWGNFYLNPKTLEIQRKPHTPSANQKTMAAQLIFEQLWKVYQEITQRPQNQAELLTNAKKICKSLNLSLNFSDSHPKNVVVRKVMSTWLPLADVLLAAVVKSLPSPRVASPYRLRHLFQHLTNVPPTLTTNQPSNIIQKPPIVVYIAKFLAADLQQLRLITDNLTGREELSDFVAFSRVFSGSFKTPQKLYVTGTQFLQTKPGEFDIKVNESREAVLVQHAYQLMGRDLTEISEVHSGAIVALHIQRIQDPSGLHSDDAGTETPRQRNSFAPDQNLGSIDFLFTHNREITTVDRSITLSDSPLLPPLRTVYQKVSTPILYVSIEPKYLRDTTTLLNGLATLYKADPGVEVRVSRTGEMRLGCIGDLHLEKCINDLQNLYAQVPFKVSPPVVSVRETLDPRKAPLISTGQPHTTHHVNSEKASEVLVPFPVWATNPASPSPSSKFPVLPHTENVPDDKTFGDVELGGITAFGTTADGSLTLAISAQPLPPRVTEWIDIHAEDLDASSTHKISDNVPVESRSPAVAQELRNIWTQPSINLTDSRCHILPPQLDDTSIVPFPGTLLGVSVSEGSRCLLFMAPATDFYHEGTHAASEAHAHLSPANRTTALVCTSILSQYIQSALLGFRLACESGPLCEEPVVGVAFTIRIFQKRFQGNVYTSEHDTNFNKHTDTGNPSADNGETTTPAISRCSPASDPHSTNSERDNSASLAVTQSPYGPLSGQIISCVKETCRKALLQRGRTRIYEAMNKLELSCEQEVLGKSYGVLSRRRAQVTSEVLKEGTSIFQIEAFLPLVDSLDLAVDLRDKASGHIGIRLQFSHWQMLEEDPFPEASMTKEALEEEGEAGFLSFPSNVSRRLIFEIRKRKGLPTDEKVIQVATKQRTLTRNK